MCGEWAVGGVHGAYELCLQLPGNARELQLSLAPGKNLKLNP